MKTKIALPALIILLLIASACEKKEDTPSCSYPKNAKLKRIVLCQSDHSDCPTKECDDIAWIEEEYEYDSKGRIEKVMFHPKYVDDILSEVGEYDLYEYDSKNQLIKIEHYITYRDEYALGWNYIYTYSDDGKKTKEYIDHFSVGFEYTLYKYTNDRLTRIEKYELNSDEIEYYILNEYDDSGNLIKETFYDKDDIPIKYTQHIYENDVNIESYEYIWGYTEPSNKFIKTYDENDNLVLLESFYGPGSSKFNKKLKFEYYN